VPFREWAARNPLKLAIAVLGGVLALSVNSLAGTLIDLPPSSSGPSVARVRIEAKDGVCWKVSLGFAGRKDHRCGTASLWLDAEKGQVFEAAGVEGHFFASVTKVFRREVNSDRVTIVLLVDGREVDRASTTLDTASVHY
jgi:hypothetical protein